MLLDDYKNMIHRCFRCGYCKYTTDYTHFNCPVYSKHRVESHAPGGMLWLIRAMMMDEIKITPELAKLLYSCTMCSNCADKCPIDFNEHIVDMLVAARLHVVHRQRLPLPVRMYLMSMLNTGNPWKRPQIERGGWAKGTNIRAFDSTHDYLFYVGDICSYYDRGNKTAAILGDILNRAGVSCGILGPEEHSDGNDVFIMGEEELFLYLARENIRSFEEKGVKKVCAISPHAYNAMKNYYPKLGGVFEVYHYTQVLRDCIDNKKIKFSGRIDKKVTFHDPCFLGRWNGGYEPPREVLTAVPGLDFIEIERNGRDSFCCGGGGGNCFTDVLGGGPESPSRIRVREACKTGADVLAVACPACMLMLDDALKAENLEGKIEVKDISEILYEAV
jgi:Fe-S oxidoreductase